MGKHDELQTRFANIIIFGVTQWAGHEQWTKLSSLRQKLPYYVKNKTEEVLLNLGITQVGHDDGMVSLKRWLTMSPTWRRAGAFMPVRITLAKTAWRCCYCLVWTWGKGMTSYLAQAYRPATNHWQAPHIDKLLLISTLNWYRVFDEHPDLINYDW